MASVWQTLIGNFACVALIMSSWMHISYRRVQPTRRQQEIYLGVALGLASVASMALAIQFAPGIYLDLRLSMAVVSAVFGGPLSLLTTLAMAGAFRVALGGAGAGIGLLGLVITSCGGLLLWRCLPRSQDASKVTILAASIAAALLSVAVLALLPSPLRERAFRDIAAPISLANFAVTATAGWAIRYFRQFTLERDILHAALTQAPDFHYVKDPDSRFVVANQNLAWYHGRQGPGDLIGLSDFDLEPVARARQLFQREQSVLRTGIPAIDHEECVEKGDGGLRWYSTSNVPLFNRHGDLVGLAGRTADITERKRLEAELLSSRNVMARAMAEMTDGLAYFDAGGTLIFCNEQYQTLFPRSAYARVPGAHITDIIRAAARSGERHDLPVDADDNAIQRAADVLYDAKDEVLHLFDDRWIRLRTCTGDDGSSLVVVSDVTLMKRNEDQLRELADQMKDLASIDGLTGLANRRVFDETLDLSIARCAGNGSALSLLLIDIDRFKTFNDTYGHTEGDACLRLIGGAIGAAAKRKSDLAARYGGEEFCLLLPGVSLDRAVVLGDRLRAAIRDLAVPHSGSDIGVVTASIGVASLQKPFDETAALGLVISADRALYHAKKLGRDRTEVAAPSFDLAV